MRIAGVCGVSLVLGLGLAAPAAGQEGAGAEETINLFFDCQGSGCYDLDFFRREIPYVNWVRDRESADLHVLVTSRATGGGGREHTLAYIGRGPFQGRDQELVVHTSGDATTDEVRNVLVSRLRLGLGPYLAGLPVADRLRLTVEGPSAGAPAPAAASAEDDPWDFWVFNIGASTSLNGESSYSSERYSTNLSANRTTDAWKLSLSARYSRYTQEFEVDETTTVRYRREDWSTTGLAVKSITDRLSLGARAGVGASTYVNEDIRWNLSPGVEFNIFPYSESSRRSFTLQALLNVRHWDYDAVTIFGETEETRVAPSVHANLGLVQPWGRVNVGTSHSRYLHDTSRWQSTIDGFLEVRLFKGFSVNLFGSYGWIRDQLYLEAEGATEEEILLRQRALATDFNYFTSFGISYRFGSIFNNVVNPRFGSDGGGGGMVIMF